jgi:ribosomal-protein-alanine N-acetyltransferase
MSKTCEIKTDRLVALPVRLEDLEDYQALDADPEVERWAVGGPATDGGMKTAIKHWEEHCLGLWTFHHRDGAFVGYAGMTYSPTQERFQLRYAVVPGYRRRRYATEMIKAVVAFAFNAQRLDEVIAAVDEENTGSCRVMVKCGFRYDRETQIYRLSFPPES